MHPIVKFHRFGFTEAFEKTKDLLIGRKKNITIEISYCLITVAETPTTRAKSLVVTLETKGTPTRKGNSLLVGSKTKWTLTLTRKQKEKKCGRTLYARSFPPTHAVDGGVRVVVTHVPVVSPLSPSSWRGVVSRLVTSVILPCAGRGGRWELGNFGGDGCCG